MCRKWLFGLLFLFTGSVYAQLTCVTYNIRYNNPSDNENAWPKRRSALADSITGLSPDILCLQEALKEQYRFLSRKLKNYNAYGVGRNNGKRKGEYCPVFFRKDKFKLVNKGTFWLSETPGKPGKGWDASANRIVSWVKLEETVTQKLLFVFNTHFDDRGSIARFESARLLTEKAHQIAGNELCLIMGDLNCKDQEVPYKYIVSHQFKDTYKATNSSRGYTYTGFRLNDAHAKRIDYIFYKGPVELKAYKTLPWQNFNGSFLSDHLPVWVKFGWE